MTATGAGAVLAQAATDERSLAGWYVGIVIGFAVVLVVVVIVAFILDAAAKIRRQAGMAADALDQAQVNTLPLWAVADTNRAARAILEGAIRAREAVEQS